MQADLCNTSAQPHMTRLQAVAPCWASGSARSSCGCRSSWQFGRQQFGRQPPTTGVTAPQKEARHQQFPISKVTKEINNTPLPPSPKHTHLSRFCVSEKNSNSRPARTQNKPGWPRNTSQKTYVLIIITAYCAEAPHHQQQTTTAAASAGKNNNHRHSNCTCHAPQDHEALTAPPAPCLLPERCMPAARSAAVRACVMATPPPV